VPVEERKARKRAERARSEPEASVGQTNLAQPSEGRTRSPFELIPSIDVLAGRCVRLAQGDYAQATVYSEDPAEVAERFARLAIPRLHVVDLDGAKAGRPLNAEVLRRLLASAGRVPVQLGGGLRDLAAIEAALATGVSRVVLGTLAAREPAVAREAARRHPGRIAVGIDARDGQVAIEGWRESSGKRAIDLARELEDAGVAAIIFTDIGRDGMLQGPNLAATAELAAHVTLPVIVSGGIRSAADVLAAAAYSERGIGGVIVGRALYTGGVDLAATLEQLACC
jgi:phosphoribosylformimino-5-aminoimidazole carboxamide ribotide isomerase